MIFDANTFKLNFSDLISHLSGLSVGGYPLDYQRIDQKTLPVIQSFGHLEGHKVLEVGSNFGMYTLLLSPLAKVITGLEVEPSIFKVSQEVKGFFEGKGHTFDNVRFLQKSSAAAVDVDYDAALLTLVLYHLENHEIDALHEDLKKKCEKILIQCRPGRIFAKARGSLTGHISKNSRYDGLCDIASNIRFMQDAGMKRISVTVNSEMLGNEVFPVLVGER